MPSGEYSSRNFHGSAPDRSVFKNPMLVHENPIKLMGRYLYHTKKEGIFYNPDTSKYLECYVDADFDGGLSQAISEDASNVMSRTGMIIVYANCPIYWRILLQADISLTTAKDEYIALSSALRELLPLMKMI